MMKKTPKIKHPNLHYKINTRKKTPKKNTNFQISSKKTPRKKHQFCKFSKKTPTDITPISEKGKKKQPKKHLPDYHCPVLSFLRRGKIFEFFCFFSRVFSRQRLRELFTFFGVVNFLHGYFLRFFDG